MKRYREFHLNKPCRFRDDIEPLLIHNDYYEESLSELKEFYGEGDRIYEYEFPNSPVELILKEDGSVRVDYQGVTIGYIKDEDSGKVSALLSDPSYVCSNCFVESGKYVELYEDEETLRLNKRSGEAQYDVYIVMAFEEQKNSEPTQPAKAKAPKIKPIKSRKLFVTMRVMCVILVLLSLILALAIPLALAGIPLAVWGWFMAKVYLPEVDDSTKDGST